MLGNLWEEENGKCLLEFRVDRMTATSLADVGAGA